MDANWNQVCVRGSEPDWRQGHNDSAAVAPAAFLVGYLDWALSWTEGTDRVVLLIGGYQHNMRNLLCGGPSLHLILQCSCVYHTTFLTPQPLRKDKCLLSFPPGNISWSDNLYWWNTSIPVSLALMLLWNNIMYDQTYIQHHGVAVCAVCEPVAPLSPDLNCSPQPHYTLTLLFPYMNTS